MTHRLFGGSHVSSLLLMLLVQVCRVDLQLQQFARDNVMLVPDTMELLTDTELTQYFIQAWSLDYNDKGAYSRGAPCTVF